MELVFFYQRYNVLLIQDKLQLQGWLHEFTTLNQMNYSRQHVSVVCQQWWHVRAVIDEFELYMGRITIMGNIYVQTKS